MEKNSLKSGFKFIILKKKKKKKSTYQTNSYLQCGVRSQTSIMQNFQIQFFEHKNKNPPTE